MLVVYFPADDVRYDRRQIGIGQLLRTKYRHVLLSRSATVDQKPGSGSAGIAGSSVRQLLLGRDWTEHPAHTDGAGLPQRVIHERRQGEPAHSRYGRAQQIDHAVRHLAHLMLLQAFRLHLSRQAGDRVGLLYALAGPHLGKAIEAMHANPARRWTLAELASRAGLSRSIFAQGFRARAGETPIRYLACWRMMLAAEQLAAGQDTLAEVASTSGSQSESAFNTAFKRIMGRSPRRYAHLEASSLAAR